MQTVTLNEKEYPVHFGIGALRKFTSKYNIPLSVFSGGDLMDKITFDDLINLIYIGFQEGHRKAKKKFSLDVDGLSDLIDDNQGALNGIMDVFGKSMPFSEGK
tara:strand:+ start:8453 stop:8761 length:309 start_codon:yes stop_codon:yes gene_type:complete